MEEESSVVEEQAPVSDRPEWLPEKFKTGADMATSYKS